MIKKIRPYFVLSFFLAISIGCSIEGPKKSYILAEKLWGEGKYAEAVSEFDKVVQKDPKGKLGIQALYRSAMTQTLFLNQHEESIKKLQTYIMISSENETVWSAKLQIGRILFDRLEKHEQAIEYYRSLIKEKPDAEEVPEILFLIGKALFQLWKFDEAIKQYQEVLSLYADTEWAEKALFEIGETHFISAKEDEEKISHNKKKKEKNSFEKATEAYESFIKQYPKSHLVPQARFGIAMCLEEQDRLDEALLKYEELLPVYPHAQVIQIKMIRINQRIDKKNR